MWQPWYGSSSLSSKPSAVSDGSCMTNVCEPETASAAAAERWGASWLVAIISSRSMLLASEAEHYGSGRYGVTVFYSGQ